MCSSQKLLPLPCGQRLGVNTIVHHFVGRNFVFESNEEEEGKTDRKQIISENLHRNLKWPAFSYQLWDYLATCM